MNYVDTAKSLPPITETVDRLSGAINALDARVITLIDRLSRIRRDAPVCPTPTVGQPVMNDGSSLLYLALREAEERVLAQIRAVDELIDELEI